MTPGSLWMLAGLALCAAELLHPGVFLLWIGIAALGAGPIIWAADLTLTPQIVVFMLLLSLSLAVAVARRRRIPAYDGGVNAPAQDLLGKTCRVIAFDGSEGRVSLRDGTWPARLAGGSPPLPGTVLRIVGLDGTTLLVAGDEARGPAGPVRS